MKSPLPKPKRPLMFYYSIVLLAMFVFNLLVMPYMMRQQITTIEYSTFLTMVDEGKLSTVVLEETRIYMEGIEDASGKKPLYETGYIYDPGLVERLSANKSIKFYSEIPEEVSPILEFIEIGRAHV